MHASVGDRSSEAAVRERRGRIGGPPGGAARDAPSDRRDDARRIAQRHAQQSHHPAEACR